MAVLFINNKQHVWTRLKINSPRLESSLAWFAFVQTQQQQKERKKNIEINPHKECVTQVNKK